MYRYLQEVVSSGRRQGNLSWYIQYWVYTGLIVARTYFAQVDNRAL